MADVDDIPGLPELWQTTRGDPSVRIALLDGPPDVDHGAFRGARIEVARPYWAQEADEALTDWSATGLR